MMLIRILLFLLSVLILHFQIACDNNYSMSSRKSFPNHHLKVLASTRKDSSKRIIITKTDYVHTASKKDEAIKKNIEQLLRNTRSLFSQNLAIKCNGNFSCRGKCLNSNRMSYNDKLSCFCDINCEHFQDCCADFNEFCKQDTKLDPSSNATLGKSQSHTTNFTSTGTININTTIMMDRDKWSCFSFRDMKAGIIGIWMIGSCPKSWPKNDIFYQCRNLSVANTNIIDNYQHLPVYTSDGTVYHNSFCAQCNGGNLSKTKSYDLFPSISLNNSEIHINSLRNDTGSNFTLGRWMPALGDPRRYCLKLKTKCLLPDFQDRCRNGTVGIVNNNEIIFKNIYCAKCNRMLVNLRCDPNIVQTARLDGSTVSPDHGTSTPGYGYILPAARGLRPFHNILIVPQRRQRPSNPKKQTTIACSPGKVFDKYTRICREMLNDIDASQEQPYRGKFISQYEITLQLYSETNCSQCLKSSSLNIELSKILHVSKHQIIQSNFTKHSWVLMFHLRLHENETDYTKDVFQKISIFTFPFNISIAGEWFTVINSTSKKIECSKLQAYNISEYTVSKNGSFVIINKTGEVFQPKDYYMNKYSVNDSQGIIVCRHFRSLNCSGVWVSLQGEHFSILGNQSIFVNKTDKFYKPSEYLLKNITPYICEDFSSSYQVSVPNFVNANGIALEMMTIVGMSMSIISLFSLLTTYSLFTELRTPPGINLMNLSVSILLAQLLWLVGSGQTDKNTLCTAIAVLLHYFYMVSFVWTSIIAFDTWRAFTGPRSWSSTKRQRLSHNVRYMGIGWLSVMVYVAICVILDFTKVIHIGYQSDNICWMSAALYFFALPIAMFLVFNITFFTLTAKAIYVTKVQARFAAHQKDSKRSFGVYVRIASAMGFTWVFGFIAPFGWDFLWYVFVFFNSLQGVYIAVAFVFNQRVLKLYKRLLSTNGNGVGSRFSTQTSRVTGIENESMDTRL